MQILLQAHFMIGQYVWKLEREIKKQQINFAQLTKRHALVAIRIHPSCSL
jgi:hypothetical protein